MDEAIGIAPGKIIMLGEHAVVYGYPAIAIPIDLYTKVIIRDYIEGRIQINIPNYNISLLGRNISESFLGATRSLDPIKLGLELWEQQNLSIMGSSITIESNIAPGSGLGSSASVAIALYSALQKRYNLSFNERDAINFGFNMEKITHGRPSGIDNTVCAVNKPILFQQQSFRQLDINFNASLMIIDTGIPHNTQLAVNQISKLKEKNPQFVSDIFKNIGLLVEKGQLAIEMGDLGQVQDLMEKNQIYLTEIGLMTENMEKIYNLGIENHIRGLKITGAGQGGCLIALDNQLKLEKFQDLLNSQNIRNHLFKLN